MNKHLDATVRGQCYYGRVILDTECINVNKTT